MPELDDHIAAGDEHLRRGDLAGAERSYHLALEVDPCSASAMQSIGLIHAKRGDLQSALMWAQRAVEINPDYALAHNLRGNALLGLKRYEEALVALGKSPRDSRRAQVLVPYQMALCQAGLGCWQEAELDLRDALREDPTYATRHISVGMIVHDPLYADCHFLLAWVLQRQGNLHEAQLHDRLARRMDPTVALTPLAKEILGVGPTGSGGARSESSEVNEQPIRRRRSGPSLFVEALERKTADLREAEGIVTHQRTHSPPHPSTADEFERGCQDFRQQHYRESMRTFSSLCERLPGHAGLHYAVGVAYLMGGRLDDAIRALSEAKHLAPADRDVHVALKYARFCETGEIASDET